ncbi:MAG: amidase [Acidobacteriota bacterium]
MNRKQPQNPPSISRRGFLGSAAALGALATTSSTPSSAQPAEELDVREKSFTDLQSMMSSGAATSETIVGVYLERIELLDRGSRGLRSVIETNPEAIDVARELDRERAAQGPRSPLHGIPILLKDNIDTADRMTTTAGSLALEGSVAPQDSTVAARLRSAGAVLLGKANLSEWANFRSEGSSSGWSGRGGQCRNPYVLDRNPCGSSSGSGAATSANLTAAAIGTETNGSIVCPSSACGLVGIKPTVGLVSRAGIIPISVAQDTAGPMTRTVADAAALLTVLAGSDPRDPASEQRQPAADYSESLDKGSLEGRRIALMGGSRGRNRHVDAMLDETLEVLEKAGATLVDAEIEFDRQMNRNSYQAMLYEFKEGLRQYFATLGPNAPVKTLADVIAFNEANAGRELPYFDQSIMLAAEEKGPLTDSEYREAREQATQAARKGIDDAFEKYELDAILGPTGGPAWVTDLVGGDHFTGVGSSSPAAISGYPNITVPGGHAFGLPMGVSFFGQAWTEPQLIAIAYAFESLTRKRREPQRLASLDLNAPL